MGAVRTGGRGVSEQEALISTDSELECLAL